MEEDQCTAAVLEVEEDKVELEVELDILQFAGQDILQTELSLLWLKINKSITRSRLYCEHPPNLPGA